MKKSLIALSLGTFALGIAEFVMMGILSPIAHDLDVSIVKAGHLISAYALGVSFGAPMLLVLRKMPLKNLLVMLACLIAAGNCLAAFSVNYWMLLGARFISGLPHGAYFGGGARVARRLADPGKKVEAVSIMIAGMTVATLVGVPLGTYLTELVSWRLPFFIVAVAGLATYVAIRHEVPDVGKIVDTGFKGQFRFLRNPAPWLILGGVFFGQTGIYCWYSYVEPLLTTVAHFPAAAMTWIMVVAGLGMFVGNLAAARWADHTAPGLVAAIIEGSMVIVLLAISLFSSIPWLGVLLTFIGTAGLFGSGGPLQSLIVAYSKGGELLGAASIQICYNVGNAIAAFLGGLSIGAGMGYTSVPLVGMPFVVVGSCLLFIFYRRYERGGKENASPENTSSQASETSGEG